MVVCGQNPAFVVNVELRKLLFGPERHKLVAIFDLNCVGLIASRPDDQVCLLDEGQLVLRGRAFN